MSQTRIFNINSNFQISILKGKDINNCGIKELKSRHFDERGGCSVKKAECFEEKSKRNTVAPTTVKIPRFNQIRGETEMNWEIILFAR